MSLLQQIHCKAWLYQRLRDLIAHSERVVVLDAQLEPSFYQILSREFNHPLLIWNDFKRYANRTFTIFDRDLSSKHISINAADHIVYDAVQYGPVYVFCSSLTQQLALYQDMLVFAEPEDIMVINGLTPEDEKKRLFANIEEETRKCKYFLTTSCLTVGVDINTDHFKRAYGIFSRGCSSIQQFIQGVHRPRQVDHVTLFVAQDSHQRISYTTHDMVNQAVLKGQKLLKTDQLGAYNALYVDALNQSPFSYTCQAFLDMGYTYLYELLIDMHVSERKRYVREKPQTVPAPAIDLAADYFFYLRHALNHADIVEAYCANNVPPEPPTALRPDLKLFFEKAPYILKDFSVRPSTLASLKRNVDVLNALWTYLSKYGVAIEMVVLATETYHAGRFYRKVRTIVEAIPNRSTLKLGSVIALIHEQASDAISQRLL